MKTLITLILAAMACTASATPPNGFSYTLSFEGYNCPSNEPVSSATYTADMAELPTPIAITTWPGETAMYGYSCTNITNSYIVGDVAYIAVRYPQECVLHSNAWTAGTFTQYGQWSDGGSYSLATNLVMAAGDYLKIWIVSAEVWGDHRAEPTMALNCIFTANASTVPPAPPAQWERPWGINTNYLAGNLERIDRFKRNWKLEAPPTFDPGTTNKDVATRCREAMLAALNALTNATPHTNEADWVNWPYQQ
jgi:hypothetical protein